MLKTGFPLVATAALVFACSSNKPSDVSPHGSSGGYASSGAGSGGVSANSGAPNTNSGGSTSLGGVANTGGASGVEATGGVGASGDTGASGSAGAAGSADAAGGTGASGSAGAAGARGGAVGSGGRGASGGASGAEASGGAVASGGAGAGGASGGAVASGGLGGFGAAGASGSAGASSDGGTTGLAERAVVASYLGGMVVYSVEPDSGALEPITGSPFDKGAQLLGVAVSASGKFAYATDYTKGLRSYGIAPDSGRLSPLTATPIALPGTVDGPIAIDPQDRYLYASADQKLYTYVLGDDGVPSLASGTPPSVTVGVAFIAAEPSGRFVYVAGSTGIVGYRVNADTGELEPAASAAFGTPTLGGALALAPSGHYLYSSAGGLNTFSIDSQTGALGLLSPTPYSLDVGGDSYSRVLALDPTGQFAFSVHMLNGHFGAFQVAPSTGILSGLEGFPVTLAQGVYSVGVEPSGRFVYVGSDAGTISGYSLDRAQRTLTAMSGPPFPLDGLQPEIAFVTLGLR